MGSVLIPCVALTACPIRCSQHPLCAVAQDARCFCHPLRPCLRGRCCCTPNIALPIPSVLAQDLMGLCAWRTYVRDSFVSFAIAICRNMLARCAWTPLPSSRYHRTRAHAVSSLFLEPLLFHSLPSPHRPFPLSTGACACATRKVLELAARVRAAHSNRQPFDDAVWRRRYDAPSPRPSCDAHSHGPEATRHAFVD